MPMYPSEHWRGWNRPNRSSAAIAKLAAGSDRPHNWWTNQSQDGELHVIVRLQPAPNGRVEMTAIMFERDDGAPLAVRDIAGAHIGELIQAARHTRGWMVDTFDPDSMLGRLETERPTKRAGRVSSENHYREIWDMFREAQDVAPTRSVAWMREQWLDSRGEDIPWPTMTRWVSVANERFGKGHAK